MALIGDRYRLVTPIATGGMGTVWEGWDERLQRRVAIKQLHPPPGLDPDATRIAAERALREARNTARLHHPHAVPVYDVVDHEGQPCLVMQYLPAKSLQALLAERGALSVPEVARIGSEVASALEAAHQVGIVHRDVKPGNVLIDADGQALLTDFGISHAHGDPSLTSTGIVTGTPAYLAPEVARGNSATPASDVFSLGSMLYTAIEGTSPFGDGRNAMATLHRAASGEMEPPRRSGPLTPILMRMLAVDPAARPSMAEVAHVLRDLRRQATDPAAFVATEQLTAAPPPRTPPPSSSTVVLPPVRPAGPTQPPNLPPNLPPSSPPPASPDRGNRGMLIAALVIGALILGGLVALLVSGLGDSGSGSGGSSSSSSRPAAQRRTSSTPAKHTKHKPKPSKSSSSRPPTTSAPPPSSKPATSSPAKPTSGGPASAVQNYYGLLPNNTDSAWNLLTKHFQQTTAGGRLSYDQYWNSISSVAVSGARDLDSKRAEATITYHYKDGRTVAEDTVFEFKNEGGVRKIDRTQVVRNG